MQLRTDFDSTVHDMGPRVHDDAWRASPLAGVERYLLDREGDEVAVATSLVRYAPQSAFDAHTHELGEEYFVLEGEFADEHGRYGPGTYVRNPPGSRHRPFSDRGCLIWVKLRQFHPADQTQLVAKPALTTPASGFSQASLHWFAPGDDVLQAQQERVALLTAAADTAIELPACYGMQELFVIDGGVDWQDAQTLRFERYGWLRLAPGQPLRVTTTQASVLLWKERPIWIADATA